jgi:hypothetical protein
MTMMIIIIIQFKSILKVGCLHPVACSRSGSGFPSHPEPDQFNSLIFMCQVNSHKANYKTQNSVGTIIIQFNSILYY